MYKILISLMFLMCTATLGAQENRNNGFSPEKFRADMEQFITKEACLTPKEASRFFPVYDEMCKKQRAIFESMRRASKCKPADEAGCRDAIRQRDKMDLELKNIQQTYHEKFLNIISASKLFDVIKAEEKFHRRMLKKSGATTGQDRFGHGGPNRNGPEPRKDRR